METTKFLKTRIHDLETRVSQLEREVEFLRLHPSLAQGLKGERFDKWGQIKLFTAFFYKKSYLTLFVI